MQNHKTQCGGNIVIPPNVETHLQAHPEVHGILSSAIGKIRLPHGEFMQTEVDMHRVIGRRGVTQTKLIDIDCESLFSVRTGRKHPSRVAPAGVVGDETSKVVIIARPGREHHPYILVTAWIGSLAQKEPWDPNISSKAEYKDCLDFWCSHALVQDPAVMSIPFMDTWRSILAPIVSVSISYQRDLEIRAGT